MSGHANALESVPGLLPLAQAQLGVVRRDQLRTLGVNDDHVRNQVRARRWQVIGPRLVVLRTGPLTRAQQLWAAVLHCGDGFRLGGRTALERDGFRGPVRSELHVVALRGGRAPRLPGVVMHQTGWLPDHHLAEGPPPSCTPARAAVDAVTWEPHARTAAGLVIAVVQQSLTTVEAMSEVLDGLDRPRNAPVIREALRRAATGSESLAEADVEDAVRTAGLGPIRRQVRVATPTATYHLDVVVDLPDGRVLNIEVDGVHHLDPQQRLRDAARDAELVALGYVVLRVPSWASASWLRQQLRALSHRAG